MYVSIRCHQIYDQTKLIFGPCSLFIPLKIKTNWKHRNQMVTLARNGWSIFLTFEKNNAWKVTVIGVFLIRIFPHLGWIRNISRIWENTDQKNSECGLFFRSNKSFHHKKFHQNISFTLDDITSIGKFTKLCGFPCQILIY